MARSSTEFKAIILAGGSGERFWPLSTPEHPKQFLRVFGGMSLIRQAVVRLEGIVKPSDVFVVTAKSLVATTRRELPELPRANILGEPMRRDTGAAVALGVRAAGKGVLGFFPADQLVTRPKAFRASLKRAISRAKKAKTIVTIGISPEYPATGFGYIDSKTGRFFEKPSAARARQYVKKGYLWNAGMFIARDEVFRAAFASYAPGLLPLLESSPKRPLAALYRALPRISFDYAVMEKLPRVEVVPSNCGWDDVGGYAAFDRYFPHDACGNVREGPCTVVEASDNICIARSARISLLGVKNLVVVTTPDAVLVVDKCRVAEMKKLFRT